MQRERGRESEKCHALCLLGAKQQVIDRGIASCAQIMQYFTRLQCAVC